MNSDELRKMREVTSQMTREKSLQMTNERKKIIDAEMEKIRQRELEQDQIFLEELSDEERDEVFMVLQ